MNPRILCACVVAGVIMLGYGLWIPAKAALAQVLLGQAWERSVLDGGTHKPWPWADTHPVARITVPDHGVDLIALAGDAGNSLAFGPGHVSASGAPGSLDTVAFGGHRDTHFRFLEHVQPGDTIIVQSASGDAVRYVVDSTAVADSREASLRFDPGTGRLALITCYPFDALSAGGPLRYIVAATAENRSL